MMHMFANHSNVAVSPNEPLMMMTRLVYIYISDDRYVALCVYERVCVCIGHCVRIIAAKLMWNLRWDEDRCMPVIYDIYVLRTVVAVMSNYWEYAR